MNPSPPQKKQKENSITQKTENETNTKQKIKIKSRKSLIKNHEKNFFSKKLYVILEALTRSLNQTHGQMCFFLYGHFFNRTFYKYSTREYQIGIFRIVQNVHTDILMKDDDGEINKYESITD